MMTTGLEKHKTISLEVTRARMIAGVLAVAAQGTEARGEPLAMAQVQVQLIESFTAELLRRGENPEPAPWE